MPISNMLQLFTRFKAKEIVEDYPNTTWANIPADKQTKSKNQVNELLVQEGIPEVDDYVYTWRMSQAFKDAIAGKCSTIKWVSNI